MGTIYWAALTGGNDSGDPTIGYYLHDDCVRYQDTKDVSTCFIKGLEWWGRPTDGSKEQVYNTADLQVTFIGTGQPQYVTAHLAGLGLHTDYSFGWYEAEGAQPGTLPTIHPLATGRYSAYATEAAWKACPPLNYQPPSTNPPGKHRTGCFTPAPGQKYGFYIHSKGETSESEDPGVYRFTDSTLNLKEDLSTHTYHSEGTGYQHLAIFRENPPENKEGEQRAYWLGANDINAADLAHAGFNDFIVRVYSGLEVGGKAARQPNSYDFGLVLPYIYVHPPFMMFVPWWDSTTQTEIGLPAWWTSWRNGFRITNTSDSLWYNVRFELKPWSAQEQTSDKGVFSGPALSLSRDGVYQTTGWRSSNPKPSQLEVYFDSEQGLGPVLPQEMIKTEVAINRQGVPLPGAVYITQNVPSDITCSVYPPKSGQVFGCRTYRAGDQATVTAIASSSSSYQFQYFSVLKAGGVARIFGDPDHPTLTFDQVNSPINVVAVFKLPTTTR